MKKHVFSLSVVLVFVMGMTSLSPIAVTENDDCIRITSQVVKIKEGIGKADILIDL